MTGQATPADLNGTQTEDLQLPEQTPASLRPAADRDAPAAIQQDSDVMRTEEASALPIAPAPAGASLSADETQGTTIPTDHLFSSADRPADQPSTAARSTGNISLAVPLYPRVPMLARPSWSGREVQELAALDTLLVLDGKPLHQWLHVMDVHSGAEGWVRENQVRVGASPE